MHFTDKDDVNASVGKGPQYFILDGKLLNVNKRSLQKPMYVDESNRLVETADFTGNGNVVA